MISDGSYKEFECALSHDKHFIKEPIVLTGCGHTACKRCLPDDVEGTSCLTCGVKTKRYLKHDHVATCLKESLSRHFDDLILQLNQQTENSLNELLSE